MHCCIIISILYYTIIYHTILYSTILYYAMLFYTRLYSAILYYDILKYTTLYYNMLCYAVLCYATLCYAMLCAPETNTSENVADFAAFQRVVTLPVDFGINYISRGSIKCHSQCPKGLHFCELWCAICLPRQA